MSHFLAILGGIVLMGCAFLMHGWTSGLVFLFGGLMFTAGLMAFMPR